LPLVIGAALTPSAHRVAEDSSVIGQWRLMSQRVWTDQHPGISARASGWETQTARRSVAGDDHHLARLAAARDQHAHAEAVEFDLVEPPLPGGRLGDEDGLLRVITPTARGTFRGVAGACR
jgi:hypothetical protein